MDRPRDPGPGVCATLIARLRRRFRPPRVLRPSRAGWVFFGITFTVGFAALNTGNNLLYLVLSLMLGFLTLSGVLSESALRGISVCRHPPREIYAGTDNPVRLEITNRLKRTPAFAVVVEDLSVPSGQPRDHLNRATPVGRTFALRVGPRQTETRRYAFRPATRGRFRFAGFRISTRFPFGLFVKSRHVENPGEALVFPEVALLHAPATARAVGQAWDGATPDVSQGCEVTGLREFESGDSPARVHWKSSLRRGSLLVAQVEDDRNRQCEVHLRTTPKPTPHGAGEPQAFEQRVRDAASEVVSLLAAGLGVALRTDSQRLPFGYGDRHRMRLLAFLALVDLDSAPKPSATTVRVGSLVP